MKSNPIAVLISDVHYNINTLPLADTVVRQAVAKANELGVPLIVAGDLHDTKANLRAECVNAMIETFKLIETKAYALVGNHCKINEKSDDHALNFLRPYVDVVDTVQASHIGWLVPYQHDVDELRKKLFVIKKGATLIMHQGMTGSEMGDYIQDKSALNPKDVAGLRVISGHYHTRQTIQLPDGGKWDYLGNPYTLSWGEAKDPEKGFQILNQDGSLTFVPTNLRKHVVIEVSDTLHVTAQSGVLPTYSATHKPGDLVFVKVRGSREFCTRQTREALAESLHLEDFRLELIPDDVKTQLVPKSDNQPDMLDKLIESLNTNQEQTTRLKNLWRTLR